MDFLKLTQEAYEASTAYIEANFRAEWDYSLRTFRLEHAQGSKYLSDSFKARSRIVSPQTRSIIRKNEAAGAVALFSNMETVNLEAGNPDDPYSVASTEAMKAVLEYRLHKTIPTFEVCMGGIQDAQTQGVVVSYQYWEYDKKKKIDRPCVELRPIENIRLDPGASWIDPVRTSPYFADIIPMYVCDVRAMMKAQDDKTGRPKWKKYDDAVLEKARPEPRQTQRTRHQDPHEEPKPIGAFDVIWVMRWFMKDSQGEDHAYYSLGTEALLTDPKPLAEVYFHGLRPYEMGYAILETHRVMKTSLPMLLKPLQQESTDLRNQRLDNVKFAMNPRWLVASGRQVDVQSLVENRPGGVTLTSDPNTDIRLERAPDVTSSSYVEHDRLRAEGDDLAGNFSPNTRVANKAMNDTLGGSRMATQAAGIMTDYMLRTIFETWWEKVLRQLVLLEAKYETDQTVLGICARKAGLFPRFGISRITDDMLEGEMTLTVNVGFGASDPWMQLQKFIAVTQTAIAIVQNAPAGFNVAEQVKEMYSKAGYRDGSRFFGAQGDPRLIKAMQMVEQLQGALKSKGLELQAGLQDTQMKLASAERIKQWELQVDVQRIGGDLRLRDVENRIDAQRLSLEQLQTLVEAKAGQQEQQGRLIELSTDIEAARLANERQRLKNAEAAMELLHDQR
ncbi:MAG: hypothetical protein FJX76_01410 [Armatimonadetes bacterium]|nr:hypothetical protein [Armatimonadota bacterium]